MTKAIKEKEQENYLLHEQLNEREAFFGEKLKEKETAVDMKTTTANENMRTIKELEAKVEEMERHV